MADAALSLGDGCARHADHSQGGFGQLPRAPSERATAAAFQSQEHVSRDRRAGELGWVVGSVRLQLFLVLAAVDNMDLLAERQVSERAKSTCQFFALFYAFARTC